MGILIGGGDVTRFSYIEYQALMLCLAALMCMGLVAIEFTMRRFQVLPLLFPGMFSIREREFYFFDLAASDGGKRDQLRAQAKMLLRMTLCVVLSYLWQRCVLETTQQVGTEFPHDQCEVEADCFASALHYMTFVNREHTPVDCSGHRFDFPSRVVVTCIRFVQPSAPMWLMHLAVAHSVSLLNLKCYEILVWLAGNSSWFRRMIGLFIFLSLTVPLLLFFSGVTSEFMSSWLNFTMSLSAPVFFYTVWKTAKILQVAWYEEGERVQMSIAEHLNVALADFCEEERDGVSEPEDCRGLCNVSKKISLGNSVARGATTARTLLSMLPKNSLK